MHVYQPIFMARNPPDEWLVYLALRNIFKGAEAQLRRPKKVRELIQKHQHCADVRDLLEEHNVDTVCSTAEILLDNQIMNPR